MGAHVSLSPDKLPPILGFGHLDQATVRSERGRLAATYLANGQPAYLVQWSPGRCLLTAFYQGREVGVSGGPDLQHAFQQTEADDCSK
jgi:hypothetical protein